MDMNERLLRSEMILHGDGLEDLANYLNIVRQTLSRKLCGEADFTQTEMIMIKGRYGLNDEKFARIFARSVTNEG